MRLKLPWFLFLCGLAAGYLPATPPEDPPAAANRTLRIPRVSQPPRLDDFLASSPPGGLATLTAFIQREPVDGAAVTQPTAAYLGYDDKNLYVVFICTDEPGRVRARMSRREDIGADDQVSVYLDTFHDGQRAYAFSTNPYGIQRDSIVTEGRGEDTSFDTLWHSEGRLTETGYAVSMTIPFRSLRFPRTSGQTWGFALGRSFYRDSQKTFWPAITLRQATFVGQFGLLEGLDNLSPALNLQLIPYATFAHARLLDYGRNDYRIQREFRVGLDSKLVLRDALSLDVTVNPDFSQVESDDPQVTINQRFEVFFPEKRPFFLENSGFFETPVNLFFSRRIIDPEFGTRLSGKIGRWALGALVADDRAAGAVLPATDPLHDHRVEIGVARLQREIGRDSRIGAFASSREFGDAYNRLASIDTRLRLNKNWTFTGQAMQSYTRLKDGKRFTGPGYYADLRHTGRHFRSNTTYQDRSPEFRSELGFVPRVDVRQLEQNFGYFWWPSGKSRLTGIGPSVYAGINYDRAGRVQDRWAGAYLGLYFTGPTGVSFSSSGYYILYLNQGFRTTRNDISFYTSYWKWVDISSYFSWGSNINYNPAAGLSPFAGRAMDGTFKLEFQPTRQLRWSNVYFYARLGSGNLLPSRTSVFNNHLVRSKMTYQFTRALSARLIFDYYAALTNPTLIWQDNYKRLNGDVLIVYQVNPGTALFFGYTNRFENVLLETIPTRRISPAAFPGTSTGRQVFVKLNYLLRF